jgi:acetyl-CoA decarbonylase/synthase complex subunit gamma
MHYTVEPGLYALGQPDGKSPVMVTANYKMSFDNLRGALPERDAWILALDTKGINVWCAAGKGTFGTAELVERIKSSGLEQVVDHRELILPQLGAPGVAAHQVKKLSGFKVHYGPIRAADLPAFLDSGLKAAPEMRRKSFGIWERLILVPVELVGTLKPAMIALAAFFILGGLLGPQGFWANAMNYGLFAVSAVLSAVFAGAVLTPLLLPWLPGPAFALKGAIAGLGMAVFMTALRGIDFMVPSSRVEAAAWLLLIPAIASYLGMNFTGASTYTSLSGVREEMRWAVPLQAVAAVLGVILWIAAYALA